MLINVKRGKRDLFTCIHAHVERTTLKFTMLHAKFMLIYELYEIKKTVEYMVINLSSA